MRWFALFKGYVLWLIEALWWLVTLPTRLTWAWIGSALEAMVVIAVAAGASTSVIAASSFIWTRLDQGATIAVLRDRLRHVEQALEHERTAAASHMLDDAAAHADEGSIIWFDSIDGGAHRIPWTMLGTDTVYNNTLYGWGEDTDGDGIANAMECGPDLPAGWSCTEGNPR